MVVLGTPFWITRAMSSSVPPWIQRLSVRSGPLPPRPAPPWQPLHRPRNSAWPSASAAGSGVRSGRRRRRAAAWHRRRRSARPRRRTSEHTPRQHGPPPPGILVASLRVMACRRLLCLDGSYGMCQRANTWASRPDSVQLVQAWSMASFRSRVGLAHGGADREAVDRVAEVGQELELARPALARPARGPASRSHSPPAPASWRRLPGWPPGWDRSAPSRPCRPRTATPSSTASGLPLAEGWRLRRTGRPADNSRSNRASKRGPAAPNRSSGMTPRITSQSFLVASFDG